MATARTSSPVSVRDGDRATIDRDLPRVPAAVRAAVLARLAAGGRAAHADLARDLSPYLSHKLSAGAIRELIAGIVADLASADLVADDRGRIILLAAGLAEARQLLAPGPLPKDWIGMRDCRLTALALSVSSMSGAAVKAVQLKALGTPEGLKAAVLQATYGLSFAPRASVATLRSELAVVALGRAFGPAIREQVRARDGFPPRTARVLAAQLSRRPRDLGTDAKLIAGLAAEAAGAFQPDADAIRTAVLRRWIGASIDAVEPLAVGETATVEPDRSHRPAAANRPGLDGFVAAVMELARQKAEGWSGNRKTAIARVYDALTLAHPAWALSEAEFKAMLIEAHRLGRIVLSTADLKSKDGLVELQRSAVAYRNAVVHFVRVDE